MSMAGPPSTVAPPELQSGTHFAFSPRFNR
jgi:hypothetical protein